MSPPLLNIGPRTVYRPRYSLPGGGNLVEGGRAYVDGSFTANSVVPHSAKAALEAASSGTNLYDISALSSAGWSNADTTESDSPVVHRTKVSTTRAAFGTKSFACANDGAGHGTFGCAYTPGGTISEILICDFAYFDYAGAGAGQWKMGRMSHGGRLTDDSPATLYFANWFDTGPGDFIYSAVPGGTGWETGYNGVPGVDFNIGMNGWHQRFFHVKASSGTGVSDGVAGMQVWNPSGSSVCSYSDSTLNAFTDANRWDAWVYQNYQGNGNFDSNPSTAYVDDPFIIVGNQGLVMLGNASTFAACTVRMPQKWGVGDWGTSRIYFDTRQGMLASFTTSTCWVYIKDPITGAVNSNGYTPVVVP